MGALVSKEHKEKVQRYVDYAIEDGGQILCGETVNVPLLEDEEGPDKEENGRMIGGNILMFFTRSMYLYNQSYRIFKIISIE